METNSDKNVETSDDLTIKSIEASSTSSLKSFKDFSNLFKIKNNKVALVILCLCALIQNVVVGGANNAILTTIERAYYMTSIESAVFLTLYDVANIIASPIIGYFGDKLHKPTVIGLSMIGLSIGSIITTIPEFLSVEEKQFETYQNDVTVNTTFNSSYYSANHLCYNNTFYTGNTATTTNTPEKSKICGSTFLNNLKYIFYMANMVNGVSSVALYTSSISYIENIFSSNKAPLCQGIYYAIGALGIGIGMLATGNLLNINASVAKKNYKKIDSSNVNWIGAWWIIYAINAIISFILALLVMRFSNRLNLKKCKTKSSNSNIANSEGLSKNGLKYHLKQFKASGYVIITNKCYIFIVICTTFETLLIKGYSSYLTKYLEYQYRLPASTATIITGGIGFVSLIGGSLLGAFLIKKYKWDIRQCTKFITFVLFLTTLFFLGLIVHCPQEEFINSNHFNEMAQVLTDKNITCKCDPNAFNPVCYKTDYIFISQCYAGCTTKIDGKSSSCHVLNYLAKLEDAEGVQLSTCSRPAAHCTVRLIIVCFVGFIVLFMSSIILMPILKIILGCVDVESQSFALGIRSFVTKLFGKD
jgi:organic anion transporter 4A